MTVIKLPVYTWKLKSNHSPIFCKVLKDLACKTPASQSLIRRVEKYKELCPVLRWWSSVLILWV